MTITIWTFFATLQLTATTYPLSFWAYKMLHFGSFSAIEHENSPIYVSYLSAFNLLATVGLSYIVFHSDCCTDLPVRPHAGRHVSRALARVTRQDAVVRSTRNRRTAITINPPRGHAVSRGERRASSK
ncbi:MAG: hypothetical protein V5A27_09665 [Halapricum sp.]